MNTEMLFLSECHALVLSEKQILFADIVGKDGLILKKRLFGKPLWTREEGRFFGGDEDRAFLFDLTSTDGRARGIAVWNNVEYPFSPANTRAFEVPESGAAELFCREGMRGQAPEQTAFRAEYALGGWVFGTMDVTADGRFCTLRGAKRGE